jgi:hypothetical protein
MKWEQIADRREPYASYLVRIWLMRTVSGEEALALEVQSVQSGEAWHFENLETTLAFLRGRAIEIAGQA